MTTYNIGDRIEFTENYNLRANRGDQGTITYSGKGDDLANIKMDNGGTVVAFPFRFKKISAHSTFKVGALVEFTENYLHVAKKGDRATVTAVGESYLASANGLLTIKLKDGSSTVVYGRRLKLVFAAAGGRVPKFKLGQRVVAKKGAYNYGNGDKPLVVLADWKRTGEEGYYGVGPVGNSTAAHSETGWYTYNEVSLEAYEPTFEVGDYVEVWGYNPHTTWEGLKGEVKSFSWGNYVVDFGNTTGTFTPSSLRKAERPVPKTLLQELGYKVGDAVRWTGIEGPISNVFKEKGGVVAATQTNKKQFIRVKINTKDYSESYLPEEIELGTPEPVFKVGDWVEVSGHGSTWDGTQGEITALPDKFENRFTINRGNGEIPLYFYAKALKAAVKPFPTFKVGDFVEVVKGWHTGVKAEVESIGEYTGFNYYRLIINGVMVSFDYDELRAATKPVPKTVLDRAGVEVGDKVYWSGENDSLLLAFRENGATVIGASSGGSYIKADVEGTTLLLLPSEVTLEKPKVKTWAELAPVGTEGVTKDKFGKKQVGRFIRKTAENEWHFVYPGNTIDVDTVLAINKFDDDDMAGLIPEEHFIKL